MTRLLLADRYVQLFIFISLLQYSYCFHNHCFWLRNVTEATTLWTICLSGSSPILIPRPPLSSQVSCSDDGYRECRVESHGVRMSRIVWGRLLIVSSCFVVVIGTAFVYGVFFVPVLFGLSILPIQHLIFTLEDTLQKWTSWASCCMKGGILVGKLVRVGSGFGVAAVRASYLDHRLVFPVELECKGWSRRFRIKVVLSHVIVFRWVSECDGE